MVEGSAEGFNEIRRRCGLDEIPDRYPGNESSNKIEETETQGPAGGTARHDRATRARVYTLEARE
jgi:hypothetical protein